MVITGGGRVAGGAIEVLEKTILRRFLLKFLNKTFNYPIYTQLEVRWIMFLEMMIKDFENSDFFNDPTGHSSTFMNYAKVADLYVACHYWDNRSPFIFSRKDIKNPKWKIQIVADISCDIDGPVASTLRPSTIENPFYGYDPNLEEEVDFNNDK